MVTGLIWMASCLVALTLIVSTVAGVDGGPVVNGEIQKAKKEANPSEMRWNNQLGPVDTDIPYKRDAAEDYQLSPIDIDIPYKRNVPDHDLSPIDIGIPYKKRDQSGPMNIGTPYKKSDQLGPIDIDIPYKRYLGDHQLSPVDIDIPYKKSVQGEAALAKKRNLDATIVELNTLEHLMNAG